MHRLKLEKKDMRLIFLCGAHHFVLLNTRVKNLYILQEDARITAAQSIVDDANKVSKCTCTC